MSDQLNKVRVNTQEKLKKEAEVVVEIEQPSALQSATADYLSRKEEPHPLSSPTNLNEEQLDEGFFTKEYEDGQYKSGDEKPFVEQKFEKSLKSD